MDKNSRALLEPRSAILHPETCPRRLPRVDAHLVVSRQASANPCGDVAGQHLETVNQDGARVAASLPHAEGNKAACITVPLQTCRQELPTLGLGVAQGIYH